MIKPTIDIIDIHKSFGSNKILSGISLAINAGSVYGLVGLNGAGKTTFLRLLMGLLKPDQGSIEIAGQNPWAHSESFYSDLGVVLENDGFWGNLSIKENLKIFASAKKVLWKDALDYINQFWGDTVITLSDKKIKYLSRGQRMQCALCRAFLGWPKVLFLDEPAIALDMTAYEHFKKIVIQAKRHGATMIISSHQLDTIDDLCDRVGNLSSGLVNELETQAASGIYKWLLRADCKAEWKNVFLENCCIVPDWKDGWWSFNIDTPEEKIPVIIRKLIEAGCQIYEIKQDTTGFGDTIRSIYRAIGT